MAKGHWHTGEIMAIDVNDLFARGGRELADLLEFGVISTNTDLVFAFLAREYGFRPTAAAATALFDSFCAATAPARLSVADLIPPKDMRLQNLIEPWRQMALARQTVSPENKGPPTFPPPAPPKYLFDDILRQLGSAPDSALALAVKDYDPGLTPHENLPGGRMTAGQRSFVDHVWLPTIRPRLVAAGFWRIASVG